MARPRPGHALLLLPLVLVAGWLIVRGRTVREEPADVLRALRSAGGPTLPEARLAGAGERSEPSSYNRETLYEYIDGAAEAYLARGFERCLVATYAFTGVAGGSLDISAEVYRFSRPEGAREQMSAERPTAAAPAAGVQGAFSDATVLVAVRGRDYLKLTALTEAVDSKRPLAAIAAAWSKDQP